MPAPATATDAQLLDLAYPQRADDFRFDVLDQNLNVIGEIKPREDNAPTLTLDVSRATALTIDGLGLRPSDTAALNFVTDRVRPVMILENGSEYELGVLLFTNAPKVRASFGVYVESAALGDFGVILNQQLPQGLAFPAATNVGTALASVLDQVGIFAYSIPTTYARLAEPIAFPAGRTRLEAITTLAQTAGWVTYFDRDGTFVANTPPDLETADPAFVYGPDTTLLEGSMAESDGLLTAPNLWVVMNTSSRDVPVVGRYELPPSAPHSFANRGYYVPNVIELQGIETVAEANQAARAAAGSDPNAYQTAEFQTTADPRHWAYGVVSYMGEIYREQRWDLVLRSGGPMGHSLRRMYS